MRMTKPEGYKDMTSFEKDDFVRAWITSNHHNVDINIVETSFDSLVTVQALDKESKQIICEFRDKKENLRNIPLYADPDFREDFVVKMVAKPGDTVYMINPRFTEADNFAMFMERDNIIKLGVTSVSGANDLEVCIHGVSAESEKYGVVQQACFKDIVDAYEACSRTPKDGYNNWDEYIEAVKDITVYDYELKLDIKRGDNMVIEEESVLNSISTESEAKTIVHKVKASRIVFDCTENNVKVDVQLTPWLNYKYSGYWVDSIGTTSEVIVEPKELSGYTQKLDGYEIYCVSANYRTTGYFEKVGPSDVVVKTGELRRLRKAIEERQSKLFDEIASAQGMQDSSTCNYLKQLQVQCSAELRLLYYLEHNQGNVDKFVIC